MTQPKRLKLDPKLKKKAKRQTVHKYIIFYEWEDASGQKHRGWSGIQRGGLITSFDQLSGIQDMLARRVALDTDLTVSSLVIDSQPWYLGREVVEV